MIIKRGGEKYPLPILSFSSILECLRHTLVGYVCNRKLLWESEISRLCEIGWGEYVMSLKQGSRDCVRDPPRIDRSLLRFQFSSVTRKQRGIKPKRAHSLQICKTKDDFLNGME